MNIVSAMIDGCVRGSDLADVFGLNPRYFSRVNEADSLNSDIEILKFKNVVLVEVPHEAREYIKNYVATRIEEGEDESKYEYVLRLTNKIKIGFWK